MSKLFLAALIAYQSAAAMRLPVTTDEIEDSVDPLFWSMVNTPAPTITDVIAKGRAMLGEYGETGEIQTDLVETLLADLAAI